MKLVVASWNKKGFALTNVHPIDRSLSSQTKDDDKRINLIIDIHGLMHHHTIDIEIGAMHQWSIEEGAVVSAAILGINVIIDGILGLFDVKFAGVAIGISASVIIDTIGDVAGLLYLGHEIAGTDGMKASCGQIIDVTLMCLVGGYDIHDWRISIDSLSGNHLLIPLGSDLLTQACIDFGSRLSIDNIPHLTLSVTAMTLHGKFIVGMNLHREVLVRIDEFDEQWEMVAKLGVDLFAYEQFLVFVDEFDQRETLIAAQGNDALTTGDVTNLPRFTDIRFIDFDILECCYLFATPDGGLQKRLKFKWFHLKLRILRPQRYE